MDGLVSMMNRDWVSSVEIEGLEHCPDAAYKWKMCCPFILSRQ